MNTTSQKALISVGAENGLKKKALSSKTLRSKTYLDLYGFMDILPSASEFLPGWIKFEFNLLSRNAIEMLA